MRKLFLIPLALTTSLLLSGCKDPLWQLTFEESVRAPSDTLYLSEFIDDFYLQEIREAIQQNNLDPEAFSFEPGDDRYDIIISVKRGTLSQGDTDQLETYFKDIIHTRQTAFINAELMLDLEAAQYPDFHKDKTLQAEPNYQLQLAVEDVTLTYNIDLSQGLWAMMGGDDRDDEVMCNVVTRLQEPLGYSELRLFPTQDESVNRMDATIGNYLFPVKVPAHMVFQDSDLQARHEQGELNVLSDSDTRGLKWRDGEPERIALGIGTVGAIEHRGGRAARRALRPLEDKCRNMANQLGSPFNYQFGEGLDRLEELAVLYDSQ